MEKEKKGERKPEKEGTFAPFLRVNSESQTRLAKEHKYSIGFTFLLSLASRRAAQIYKRPASKLASLETLSFSSSSYCCTLSR